MQNYCNKRYSLYKWASHHKPFTSLREGGGPHESVVEGERDRTSMCFSCKIRAESDGVRLSENTFLIENLNEPAPLVNKKILGNL